MQEATKVLPSLDSRKHCPKTAPQLQCFHQPAACTGEAQFERHRFLTGFWVPKMVPKILQANLMFYVVFATLASQTVLVEKLKVFKKARRYASSPVLTKPLGEWEECYF